MMVVRVEHVRACGDSVGGKRIGIDACSEIGFAEASGVG